MTPWERYCRTPARPLGFFSCWEFDLHPNLAREVYAYNGTLIVADIKIQKGQLDYHFTRECPRCVDEDGWMGKINQWRGEPVIELGRPTAATCVTSTTSTGPRN